MDGLLYCQEDENSPVQLHRLEGGTTQCSLVPDDGTHVHGHDCGHQRIPHDDHNDWLVSSLGFGHQCIQWACGPAHKNIHSRVSSLNGPPLA